MITLTATTHILELTTGSATNVDVFVSYADHTTDGATLGDQQALITTATTTTILAAPAASTQRQVKYISINNTSATSNAVTVKKDISATEYDLFGPVVLGQNERLEYLDGKGWQVFTNSGAIKNSINQGSAAISSSLSSTVLGSDVSNALVANGIADVTGLSFPVTSGNKYWFRFVIWHTANATATGSRWAINGPTTTLLGYRTSQGLSAAGTAGTDVMTDVNQTAYDSPAANNATSPTATAGQANIVIIEGLIQPSANGTVIARFASEVATANSIVAKAGSTVFYQQVA
jgi:hypothetical protein